MSVDNSQISKTVQGVDNNAQSVIKGGYYVAPSSPAEPLVQTSATWGTAMPSIASPSQQPQPTQNNQQPIQQPAPKRSTT